MAAFQRETCLDTMFEAISIQMDEGRFRAAVLPMALRAIAARFVEGERMIAPARFHSAPDFIMAFEAF